MSLSAPLSITDAANQIAARLGEWAKPRGGEAVVMANMRHLWEEIRKMNDKPRCLVVFNGEVARGGFQQANTLHRVDRSWLVVVVRGHGFANLMADVEGDTEPFYDSIEAIRELLRTLVEISEEFPIDYKSTKPSPGVGPSEAANVFLDAYALEFSTANDIPAILLQAP